VSLTFLDEFRTVPFIHSFSSSRVVSSTRSGPSLYYIIIIIIITVAITFIDAQAPVLD
jgi:hypothetical protein